MDNHKDNKQMGNSTPSRRSKGRIFGFWPKRSTKVEPQPTEEILNDDNDGANKENDNHRKKEKVTFPKDFPVKRIKTQQQQQPEQKYEHEQKNNSSQIKNSKNFNNDNDRNSSNNNSKLRLPTSSSSSRKKKNNINRFSHQFHLCCSVDHKSQTPPVSVRYNSLPENVNFQPNLHEHQSNDTLTTAPLAEVEPTECCSAPESPINKKTSSFNSHSSPSITSVQSTQSDQQPRSIAITACKSRLRLKLLPPGKQIVDILDGINNYPNINSNNSDSITKQHVSSPSIFFNSNLNSNNHMMTIENNPLSVSIETKNNVSQNLRSMSHDGIQSIHRTSITSTDSLAKQALMAAQMLSLIPTEKARERYTSKIYEI